MWRRSAASIRPFIYIYETEKDDICLISKLVYVQHRVIPKWYQSHTESAANSGGKTNGRLRTYARGGMEHTHERKNRNRNWKRPTTDWTREIKRTEIKSHQKKTKQKTNRKLSRLNGSEEEIERGTYEDDTQGTTNEESEKGETEHTHNGIERKIYGFALVFWQLISVFFLSSVNVFPFRFNNIIMR